MLEINMIFVTVSGELLTSFATLVQVYMEHTTGMHYLCSCAVHIIILILGMGQGMYSLYYMITMLT